MQVFRAQDMQKQAAILQEAAMSEPVIITYHDRPRMVLMSMQEYDRLKGRSRKGRRHHRTARCGCARHRGAGLNRSGGGGRQSGVLGKLQQGCGEALTYPCDCFRLGVLFVVRDALRHYVVAGVCNAPSPGVLIVERIETQHDGVEGMAGCALSPFRRHLRLVHKIVTRRAAGVRFCQFSWSGTLP